MPAFSFVLIIEWSDKPVFIIWRKSPIKIRIYSAMKGKSLNFGVCGGFAPANTKIQRFLFPNEAVSNIIGKV